MGLNPRRRLRLQSSGCAYGNWQKSGGAYRWEMTATVAAKPGAERRARAASFDAPIGRLAFPGARLKAATGLHAMQRKPGGSNQCRYMSRQGHDLAARLGTVLCCYRWRSD